MSLELSAVETRVLGCLLEKERTTPEAYPLTLNSLVSAANQTTNRDPVMGLEAKEIEHALDELRSKKLASLVMMAGSRAQKFRHLLPEHYEFSPAETAVLCVLMLRGPQTVGELKARTERLHAFPSPEELEKCLSGLGQGSDPLVRKLPPQPGQKGLRWVQLLSGEPDPSLLVARQFVEHAVPSSPSRMDRLEEEMAGLRSELEALREEFATFRQQFES